MSIRHIIGRLTVEVSAKRVTEGQARQQEITSWIRSDNLWRDISQVLDQLVPADVVLTIPRLELTVEAVSEAGFQSQLRLSLHKAIDRLWQRRDELSAQAMPVQQHTEQLVWHFLETGTLPWHMLPNKATAVATFLNSLVDDGHTDFVTTLRKKIQARPDIWLRLVYAIGLEKAQRLVLTYGRFSQDQAVWLIEIAGAVEQANGASQLAYIWRVALIHHELAQTEDMAFRQIVRQLAGIVEAERELLSQATTEWPTSLPTNDEPTDEWPQPETFFVQNAGLALLGQFLPTLFTRLNLIDDGDFRDQDARYKAIHLLQYMVTGELETYEYDLTFNKILCHLPLSAPVPRWVYLTETDLAEADQLLSEAIRHWSILRNTSVAGLRETFLQRAGKLAKRDMGGWQLQVERKTVDILLDRLPMGWGYSVVSLPWMPDLIYVEW